MILIRAESAIAAQITAHLAPLSAFHFSFISLPVSSLWILTPLSLAPLICALNDSRPLSHSDKVVGSLWVRNICLFHLNVKGGYWGALIDLIGCYLGGEKQQVLPAHHRPSCGELLTIEKQKKQLCCVLNRFFSLFSLCFAIFVLVLYLMMWSWPLAAKQWKV